MDAGIPSSESRNAISEAIRRIVMGIGRLLPASRGTPSRPEIIVPTTATHMSYGVHCPQFSGSLSIHAGYPDRHPGTLRDSCIHQSFPPLARSHRRQGACQPMARSVTARRLPSTIDTRLNNSLAFTNCRKTSHFMRSKARSSESSAFRGADIRHVPT